MLALAANGGRAKDLAQLAEADALKFATEYSRPEVVQKYAINISTHYGTNWLRKILKYFIERKLTKTQPCL